MSFCTKCGKQLDDSATFCTACGAPVNQAAGGDPNAAGQGGQGQGQQGNAYNQPVGQGGNNNQYDNPNDNGGFWWGVFGFVFGWISIIMYFVWRNEYPRRAKAIINGFWTCLVTSAILGIILGIVFASFYADIINALREMYGTVGGIIRAVLKI